MVNATTPIQRQNQKTGDSNQWRLFTFYFQRDWTLCVVGCLYGHLQCQPIEFFLPTNHYYYYYWCAHGECLCATHIGFLWHCSFVFTLIDKSFSTLHTIRWQQSTDPKMQIEFIMKSINANQCLWFWYGMKVFDAYFNCFWNFDTFEPHSSPLNDLLYAELEFFYQFAEFFFFHAILLFCVFRPPVAKCIFLFVLPQFAINSFDLFDIFHREFIHCLCIRFVSLENRLKFNWNYFYSWHDSRIYIWK